MPLPSLDVGQFKSDLRELKLKTVLVVCLPWGCFNNLTAWENFHLRLLLAQTGQTTGRSHLHMPVGGMGAAPSRPTAVLMRQEGLRCFTCFLLSINVWERVSNLQS